MIRRPRVTNKYPYSNLFGLFLALKEFSKIRHYFLISDNSKNVKLILTLYLTFICIILILFGVSLQINKGNNKITELRTIFQRESQNS